MHHVELLVNGIRMWVAYGSTIRLCEPGTERTVEVQVGGLELGQATFVCDRAAFEGGEDNVMSCGLRVENADSIELPDYEPRLFPVILEYMHRRTKDVGAQLKTFIMSPEESKALDALMDALFPGFLDGTKESRFVVEGDEVLVVLQSSYGRELELAEMTDPELIRLVQHYEASSEENRSPGVQLAEFAVNEHLQRVHGWPSYYERPGCSLYVARVPRGTPFRISDYDGSQALVEYHPRCYYNV